MIMLDALDQIKIVRELMGTPYKLNGRSQDEGFDCLSLTKHIQKVLFDRDLPDITIRDESVRGFVQAAIQGERLYDWIQVEKPIHGCIIELCRSNIPHHCGTYLNLPGHGINGMLHSLKGAGVIFDPWITLKAAGWRRFIYNVPRSS